MNDDEHPWLARKRKARRRGSGNPDGDEAQAEGEEGDVEGEGDDAYLEEWLFDEEEEVEPWEFDDESPSYGDDGYDDADECEFDGVMREGDCSAVLSFIGQRLQATPLVLRDINDLSADELVKCGLSQAIAQRVVDERANAGNFKTMADVSSRTKYVTAVHTDKLALAGVGVELTPPIGGLAHGAVVLQSAPPNEASAA